MCRAMHICHLQRDHSFIKAIEKVDTLIFVWILICMFVCLRVFLLNPGEDALKVLATADIGQSMHSMGSFGPARRQGE